MIGAQRNENTLVQHECIFKTESYLLLARVDRMEAASLFSTSCLGCCHCSPLGCEAGGRMSEQSRGAAWWPRPRSLCTAAAAAWYVRAMYEHPFCLLCNNTSNVWKLKAPCFLKHCPQLNQCNNLQML
jgi:hypothetical protein